MTKEILNRYNMLTLEEYKNQKGNTVEVELTFYQTFLIQTDYIPNKIVEAQVLNKTIDDYTEILEYREYCREKINQLNELILMEVKKD